jgi:tetratricopeptide (TPR) repeat protein
MYWVDGNYKKATEHYGKSIKNLEGMKLKEGERLPVPLLAKVHLEEGNIHWERESWDRALQSYVKCIGALEEGAVESGGAGAGDRNLHEFARVYNNLGNLYQDMGELGRALEYYEKSLEYTERIGFLRAKPYTLLNMGECLIKKGMPEDALDYLTRSLRIFEKQKDNIGISYAKTAIALMHLSTGEPEKAIKYLEEGAEFLEEAEVPFYLGEVYLTLAKTYADLGRVEDANAYIEKAKATFENAGAKNILKLCSRIRFGGSVSV